MSVRIMSLVFDAVFPPRIPYRTRGGKTKYIRASTAKIVLLAFADHANDEGRAAYPSVALVARKTGLTERAAKNAIRALVQAGFLIPEGRGPNATISYIVSVARLAEFLPGQNTPASWQGAAAEDGHVGEPSSPPETQNTPQGVNQVPMGGEPGSPEPSINHPFKRLSVSEQSSLTSASRNGKKPRDDTVSSRGPKKNTPRPKIPAEALRPVVRAWAVVTRRVAQASDPIPRAVYARLAREARRALLARRERTPDAPWEQVAQALLDDLRTVYRGLRDWEQPPSHSQVHERLAMLWAGTWSPDQPRHQGQTPSLPRFTAEDLARLGI